MLRSHRASLRAAGRWRTLSGCWPVRVELAQADQIGERLVIEPATALDKLAAEIAEMRDGTAERSQPKLQKDPKNLKCRARPPLVGRRDVCFHKAFGPWVGASVTLAKARINLLRKAHRKSLYRVGHDLACGGNSYLARVVRGSSGSPMSMDKLPYRIDRREHTNEQRAYSERFVKRASGT